MDLKEKSILEIQTYLGEEGYGFWVDKNNNLNLSQINHYERRVLDGEFNHLEIINLNKLKYTCFQTYLKFKTLLFLKTEIQVSECCNEPSINETQLNKLIEVCKTGFVSGFDPEEERYLSEEESQITFL